MPTQENIALKSTATYNASIPNKISRVLLAFEAVVIIMPILVVAFVLALLFVGIWIPIVIFSAILEPKFENTFGVILIFGSAAGSIAYLTVVSNLSMSYVFHGRPALKTVSRIEWLTLLLGPIIPFGWVLLGYMNHLAGIYIRFYENAVYFAPGILLLIPTIHLLLAKKIAEHRSLTPNLSDHVDS